MKAAPATPADALTDAAKLAGRSKVCETCQRLRSLLAFADDGGECGVCAPTPPNPPPPPPEPTPAPRTPSGQRSRAVKAPHGWVVAYACLTCRAGLVKIAVTEKPIIRTPATTYAAIECPACGEVQRVEVQPRPRRESEDCDLSVPFLETTT